LKLFKKLGVDDVKKVQQVLEDIMEK